MIFEERQIDTDFADPSFGKLRYHLLKQTLEKYAEIQLNGGWPLVEPGPVLQLEDQGPRVAALRIYLGITGDLPDSASVDGNHYDRALETAVMSFQRRHGLEADGVVGKYTLSALNVPVEDRISILQINLERWRSFSDTIHSQYLMVNIPGFELSIVEKNKVVHKMRAIVGKRRRQTPVMSDRITYLELNPYWNIPRKIFLKDILPRIQEDPEFLAKQGIRVFDSWQQEASELDPTSIDWAHVSIDSFPYRLRQDPSEINSLGRIKFMFPNQKGVYIHDTPAKALFNRKKRTFSSGCVRVQKPLELAEYLLSERNWDREELEAAIESGHRKIFVLKEAMPVHLVYFTAWVGEGGEVNFREDIYSKDSQLLADLKKRTADKTVLMEDREKNIRLVN
jgi:murein L,D-transpeptidase YcbB/YkuD